MSLVFIGIGKLWSLHENENDKINKHHSHNILQRSILTCDSRTKLTPCLYCPYCVLRHIFEDRSQVSWYQCVRKIDHIAHNLTFFIRSCRLVKYRTLQLKQKGRMNGHLISNEESSRTGCTSVTLLLISQHWMLRI